MATKMTHPNGGKVEANADQVAMYESQGWLEVGAKSEDDDKPAKAK